MKKIVIGLMALAISFATIAQNDTKKVGRKQVNKEYKHKAKGQHGMEHLNLSEAQKTQLRSINENFRNQMKSLNEANMVSEEARNQRKKALITEHKMQIRAILTPEQIQQWEARNKKGEYKKKVRK